MDHWVLFAMCGIFLTAVANIIEKIVRTKYLPHARSLSLLLGMSDFLMVAVFGLLFTIIVPPAGVLVIALIAGMLRPLIYLPLSEALSKEDVSRLVPLYNLTPIFSLILATFFLGEDLSGNFITAFIVILIGSILISIRDPKHLISLDKPYLMVILSSLIGASQAVMIKYVLSFQPVTSAAFWFSLGSVLFTCTLLTQRKTRTIFIKDVMQNHHKKLFALLIVVFFVSVIFYLLAYASGPVSIIQAMVGFQMMFVLLFSILLSKWWPKILHEDITPFAIVIKTVAIALMMCGLVLLYL